MTSPSDNRTEQRNAIALSCLHGITYTGTRQLLNHYGSFTAVMEAKEEIDDRLRDKDLQWEQAICRANEEMDRCEKEGIEVLPLGSETYPTRLSECEDAPLALFKLGRANVNAKRVIAVVGTRRISEYGRLLCQKFLLDLKSMVPDCLVVSGLAYGVDICSHRAALEVSLPTVGILAHGLDRIYPAVHRDAAAQMVREGGGLLTEYITGTRPDKGNFVRRNRIIAGMSDATIVVESAHRGGSLITARLAQDYNRDVFAFPGRVFDQYSEGCNRLIRDNCAALITSAQDFADAMKWTTDKQVPKTVQRELFPELTPLQQSICDALKPTEGLTLNQICIATNAPVGEASSAIFDMEMVGVIKQLTGGKYIVMP